MRLFDQLLISDLNFFSFRLRWCKQNHAEIADFHFDIKIETASNAFMSILCFDFIIDGL